MDRLERTVVPAAFHNSSSTGYQPPKCAPNTRVSVLREIMAWLDDTGEGNVLSSVQIAENQDSIEDTDSVEDTDSAEDTDSTENTDSTEKLNSKENLAGALKSLSEAKSPMARTMWIRGAAGAGKTAIARSVAILCSEQGRLSGSFFFSRSRTSEFKTGRGQVQGYGQEERRRDEDSIVATLAYQMLMNIPTAEPDIFAASTRNAFIFTVSLADQLKKLILAPLQRQSLAMATPEKASLFIIDGLDETSSKEAGANIVMEFVSAMRGINHNLPHKLLVLSRPEQHLSRAVSEVGDLGLVSINLDERPEAHEDVRYYLDSVFSNIGKAHPLREVIPSGWPNRKDVSTLVHWSSGQFMYAATVMKYVRDDRGDPVERLRDITGLKRHLKNRPYGDLDDMFMQILESVPEENKRVVVLIFRIVLMQFIPPKVDAHAGFNSKIGFIQGLLGLTRVELLLILKDLSAIVTVTESKDVHFLHASIVDFLLDKERSELFYVNEERVCLELVRQCLDGIIELNRSNFLKNELTWTDPTVQIINRYLAGVRHFQESMIISRPALFNILCQWNLTEALYLVSNSKARAYMEFQFSLLLEWIVTEYQSLDSSSSANGCNPLHDVILDLKSWWISQARRFSFRDDSISGIFDHQNQRRLAHINSTLLQKEVILWLYLTTDIKKDSALHRFFCDADEWGSRSDLGLGLRQSESMAMDGRKYAVLAGYCCRFLFSNFWRNTKYTENANTQNHLEDIMLRARRALHYSECRIDLVSFFKTALSLKAGCDIGPGDLEKRVQEFLQARYTDIKFVHWIKSLAMAIADYVVKARRGAS